MNRDNYVAEVLVEDRGEGWQISKSYYPELTAWDKTKLKKTIDKRIDRLRSGFAEAGMVALITKSEDESHYTIRVSCPIERKYVEEDAERRVFAILHYRDYWGQILDLQVKERSYVV